MLRSFLSVLIASTAFTGAAFAADEVPLKIELPRPLFVGTPRPLKLANLEKPRTGRRPEIMVPAGTVNLSQDKPVTGSDPLPVIGELELITDGDKACSDGTYVEFGPGLQWVQIDLAFPLPSSRVPRCHRPGLR